MARAGHTVRLLLISISVAASLLYGRHADAQVCSSPANTPSNGSAGLYTFWASVSKGSLPVQIACGCAGNLDCSLFVGAINGQSPAPCCISAVCCDPQTSVNCGSQQVKTSCQANTLNPPTINCAAHTPRFECATDADCHFGGGVCAASQCVSGGSVTASNVCANTIKRTCSIHPQSEGQQCNGQDDDCDGVPDNGVTDCYGGPAGTKNVGICHGGTSCSGTTCVGEQQPLAEDLCGNGLDDDCNGVIDDSCAGGPHPDDPRGIGTGSQGPNPERGDCHDRQGGEVDLATGQVQFGPIELASLATPTGMPLRARLEYVSSRGPGHFGMGWDLNLEAQVAIDAQDAVVFHEGSVTRFPLPTSFALDETSASLPVYPNKAFVSRARDGSNVGFYLAKVGTAPCAGSGPCEQPALAPRLSLPDGSRILFGTLDASQHAPFLAYEDRYGNRQSVTFNSVNGSMLPASLQSGVRSLALLYTSSASSTQVNVRAKVFNPLVPGPPLVVPRVRLVIQQGYLTDVCATDSSAPARVCPGTRPTPDPNPNAPELGCSPSERTLWHFSYVQVGASPRKRLSDVMDETCAVVETHTYGVLTNSTVVALSSQTARDRLDFFNSPQFDASGALVGYDMRHSLGRTAFPRLASAAHVSIDPDSSRVKALGGACGCGAALDRTWSNSGSGVPRVQQVTNGTVFPMTTSFARLPGGSDDPFGFDLPVDESRTDSSPYNSTPKFFHYRYRHPIIRQPTDAFEPGPALGSPLISVDDYDDDDTSHPCVLGRPRNAGEPALPNEAPTPFLCKRQQFDFDATLVRTTYFQYDAAGRLLMQTNPGGDATVYDYYSDIDINVFRAGMLKTVSRRGGALQLDTTYDDYDYAGHARQVTDANGELSLREYDARGRIAKQSTRCVSLSDCGVKTSFTWEADGKPSLVTLPRGSSLHYGYGTNPGEFGRLVRVEQHGPAPAAGLLATRTYDYDVAGNLLLEQDFSASSTTPSRGAIRDFNDFHAPISQTTSTGMRVFEYRDELLFRQTDYDSNGALASSVSTWDYDGFRRLRRLDAPEGATSHFEYAPNDDMSASVDGNANRTTYDYNVFHDLLDVFSPNTGYTSYGYTIDGLLATIADADAADRENEQLELRYDALRRPLSEVRSYCPAGTSCGTRSESTLVSNSWDAGSHGLGRLASVSVLASGTTDYGYDARGQLASETRHPTGASGPTPFSLQVRYGYDSGLLSSIEYPAQTLGGPTQLVSFTRGDDDEITTVNLGPPSNPTHDTLADAVTHYPFGGGLLHYRRGNGLTTDIAQDTDGRITAVVGSPLSLNYVIDARGAPQTLTESGDSNRTHFYEHDGQLRLTESSDTLVEESFSYDATGNRTLKVRNSNESYYSVFDPPTQTGAPPNDLLRGVVDSDTTKGEWAYGYDPAGNVTSVDWLGPPHQFQFPGGGTSPNLKTRDDNAACFFYDSRRDLVSTSWFLASRTVLPQTQPRSPCVTPGTQLSALTEYRYDAQHRRVYRKDNSGLETHFLFGPSGELLAEASAGGNVDRAWVYLDGQQLALVLRDGGYPPPPKMPPWPRFLLGGGSVVVGLALAYLLLRRQSGALLLVPLALTMDRKPCDSTNPLDPILYFHNDRLGTPLRVTSGFGAGVQGRTVWSAQYRAFGDFQSVSKDPDADNVQTEQPARLPGQYDETFFNTSPASVGFDGPYYNHHRWYDPSSGRYLQPEPMLGIGAPAQNVELMNLNPPAALMMKFGMLGGPTFLADLARSATSSAAYAYAGNSPTTNLDFDGLTMVPGKMTNPPGPFENNPPPGWDGPRPAPGPKPPGGNCPDHDAHGVLDKCAIEALKAFAECRSSPGSSLRWCVFHASAVYAACKAANPGPPN